MKSSTARLRSSFSSAWQPTKAASIFNASSVGLGRRRRVPRWAGCRWQSMRMARGGYGNVWLVLVKSPALVSVIGRADVVGLADKAGKATREPFLFFVAVILVFLAITWVSGLALRYAEVRVNRGHEA